MGSRISTIFAAKCRTSQTWPNARLSLRRPYPIPDETTDLWCPRPPPCFRLSLLLCPQRVALFSQCRCRRDSSLLPRSSAGGVHGAVYYRWSCGMRHIRQLSRHRFGRVFRLFKSHTSAFVGSYGAPPELMKARKVPGCSRAYMLIELEL